MEALRVRNALSLLVVAALCLAGGARADVDLSTPEKTIESFVAALNKANADDCIACIKGARRDSATEEFFDSLKSTSLRLQVKELKAKVDGVKAIVTALTALGEKSQTAKTFRERTELEQVDGKWLIVAYLPMSDQTPLNNMAYCSAYPSLVIQEVRDAKKKTACIGQIKQLALAFLMYTTDWDDRFPPKENAWLKAVRPYLKDLKTLTCPLDPAGTISYSYNHYIAGRYSTELDLKTVLVYEGSKGKLNFRHGGKAAVGFTDGSAKLVTPEEAKTLKWK